MAKCVQSFLFCPLTFGDSNTTKPIKGSASVGRVWEDSYSSGDSVHPSDGGKIRPSVAWILPASLGFSVTVPSLRCAPVVLS